MRFTKSHIRAAIDAAVGSLTREVKTLNERILDLEATVKTLNERILDLEATVNDYRENYQ